LDKLKVYLFYVDIPTQYEKEPILYIRQHNLSSG